MINRRISKRLVLTAGLVVALGALSASEVLAKQARSRSSVSSSSQGSRGSSRGVATRSGGSGSRGAASTRSGGSGRRGHHGRGSYRGHHSRSYGISLGYYGWGGYWGGYGGYYYHPYYYHYPVYYSYHPRRFDDFGSLDLHVRPKKTEVWVDGQYVGTSGRFDGYPGHLWLEEGPHELIFFRQGHETVVREVNVLAGVVLDIAHEMQPGEAIPAEQLTSFTQERLRQQREAPEARDYPAQADRTDRVPEERARSAYRRDVREEPGRLILEIDPVDASIYLDGRFLGTGDELARLHSGLIVSPGEHTLEVVRPGFDSEEVPFFIEPGEETSLEVALTTG